MKQSKLNLLDYSMDQPLSSKTEPVPFLMAAYAEFSLSAHIMKAYLIKKNYKRIKNFQLPTKSCSSGSSEHISKYILLNISALKPEKVQIVTQACCAIHNFLKVELLTHTYIVSILRMI